MQRQRGVLPHHGKHCLALYWIDAHIDRCVPMLFRYRLPRLKQSSRHAFSSVLFNYKQITQLRKMRLLLPPFRDVEIEKAETNNSSQNFCCQEERSFSIAFFQVFPEELLVASCLAKLPKIVSPGFSYQYSFTTSHYDILNPATIDCCNRRCMALKHLMQSLRADSSTTASRRRSGNRLCIQRPGRSGRARDLQRAG